MKQTKGETTVRNVTLPTDVVEELEQDARHLQNYIRDALADKMEGDGYESAKQLR